MMAVTGACLVLSTLPGVSAGQQPGLGLRRAQEDEARRAGVGAGRPHAHDVVERAQLLVGDGRGEPAVLGAGLAEQQVNGPVVDLVAHEVSPLGQRLARWIAARRAHS